MSDSPEIGHTPPGEPPEPRRLYRSRANRVIAGVAGGIGEYLAIDPTLVRIVWVLLALLGGAGIIAYIAAWIIIPERPAGEAAPKISGRLTSEAGLIAGVILVGLGLWYLLVNLGLLPSELFRALRIVRQASLPIALVLVGVLIIIIASRSRGTTISVGGKALRRSRGNRMIAGVAGGLAEYFGIDATLVRLAWVALTLAAPATGIIAYIIAAIVMPEEPAAPNEPAAPEEPAIPEEPAATREPPAPNKPTAPEESSGPKKPARPKKPTPPKESAKS